MTSTPGRPAPTAAQRRITRVALGVAATVIFGTIFTGLFFGRCAPAAREAREFLRTLPADRIVAIHLEPYTVRSLVTRPVVITARADVEAIAAELRAARAEALNHPDARWVAVLRIRTRERDYGGQVESTSNQGVLVLFASDVQGGWNYGAVRRDDLGPLLERIVEQAGARAE